VLLTPTVGARFQLKMATKNLPMRRNMPRRSGFGCALI
jgi:hypothetical protein